MFPPGCYTAAAVNGHSYVLIHGGLIALINVRIRSEPAPYIAFLYGVRPRIGNAASFIGISNVWIGRKIVLGGFDWRLQAAGRRSRWSAGPVLGRVQTTEEQAEGRKARLKVPLRSGRWTRSTNAGRHAIR